MMWSNGVELSNDAPLSDLIALRLKNAIITGDIAPGTPLVESGLCKQYQASRNTIREALRQLRYEGLIIYALNKGAQVKVLTLSDVRDIYKIRHTLELSAIKHSQYVSERHFETIDNILCDGEKAATENRWNSVGTSSLFFHHAVVGLLESERLSSYFSTILAQLRLIFSMSINEKRFQVGWLEKDRSIYRHLVAGRQEEASEMMKLYLYESEAYVSDIVLAHQSDRRRG
ncbi:GntR family transcriptional regulator [Billgrantia pellis]|uniref:GntR family transcriptional regulator n=1 Tax=Billgrantia pellis TaxID=2606936 RepID=A0A7V7KG57_9GAMM|nr:GntR family transcriptional regulator [Halomonas pellis]